MRQVVADALFMMGTEILQSGNPRRALRYLQIAARLASKNAVYFGAAALAAFKAGDKETATRHAEKALELDRDLHSARDLLAEIFVHGEKYIAVLERIQGEVRPRTYFEIGVESGRSLRLAAPDTRAIGVDPNPQLEAPLPPNAKLYRMTSDEFFARHDLRAELGGLPVDLAFIDGMHHFEFALRDFINTERYCEAGSTIVFDDCLPRDRLTAQREPVLRFWSGDVWKVVLLLRKYRPDLSVHTIAAPPTGLCLVRNLDPRSTVLSERLDKIIEEFMSLDYAAIASDRAAKLNLVANDWETTIRPLLGSARQL
ncbi:MAG TPA: class I SAM-dependent methyltransferase [Burkholderiales bacterium]|nr:class I SAM-dependent methyltransferase [Burkholderiales bacterium]